MAFDLVTLEKDAKIWANRVWSSVANKDLMRLVVATRLNIAPCTLYKLDQLGLNHLEIINLADCAGKIIHKLPVADIDFLNMLQERHGISFGHDQKVEGKYIKARVDHYCGAFTASGCPQFVSGVLL